MNLNHFFCGSVTLKCQFMPVINLQRPRGTRVTSADWFIHNVIYGWSSQVISPMNKFLFFSRGLKLSRDRSTSGSVLPKKHNWQTSPCCRASSLSSFFFLPPSCPLSLSLRRQTVSTRELRTLSLVERSGHMPQWYVGTEGVSAGQASWLGRAAVV